MEKIKSPNNCKLSIITVNLNNKNGLEKTINSVISQTADFIEYIIIDGASSDGSTEIIKQHEDKISVWKSEPDNGIYHAMNKGILLASGNYILLLNSGDYLTRNDIIEIAFSSVISDDIVYGYSYILYDGISKYTTPHPEKLTLKFFFTETISHQATFIRRNLFEKFGLYNEDLKIHSDLEFWLKTIILNNCSFRFLNLAISNYNLDGISSLLENQKKAKIEREMVLESLFPHRVLTDYKEKERELREMESFYWAWKKKYIHMIINLLYSIASKLNGIKNKSQAI